MLIITGSLAYDYIMEFPGVFSDHILPEQIHNINLSFIVKTFVKRRGGTAGNVSYSLALLNTPHLLLSAAGKDFDEYKIVFTKIGVNMKYTKIYKDTYTSTGFAMTDKNNNQIWGYFYGATEFSDKLKLKGLSHKNDLVYIGPQGAKGSMSLIKQSADLQIPYMFDPGFILTQVSDEELAFGLKYALYLIGNDYEITMIQKRVKNFTQLAKEKIIITTLAEKGAVIETYGNRIAINPVIPKEVVDPTGAGDAWRAGFFSGLERKFDLEICGQIGAVAATYAIENYGGQEHKYTKSQFTKRYKDEYNKTLLL